MLLDGLSPATLFARLVTLLIAFTVHEFAHAWTATRFGDETPRQYGRLTLNPVAHLDIFGSIMLLLSGFGWAKPVPVNPYALGRRSSAGMMWVSLAGPASNLLMATIAAIPLRFNLIPYQPSGDLLPSLSDFLWQFMVINLVLALFNMIPIAPLDGDKIADYFFPPPLARGLEIIRPYGAFILMGLIFLPPRLGFDLLGWMIGTPLNNILMLLIGL